MIRALPPVLALLALAGCEARYDTPAPAPVTATATVPGDGAVRFRPLDVELTVGDRPLGAYQVELLVAAGDAEIVGVEGGALPGFAAAPYYDPAALAGGRIVLGAYSTNEALPADGTHRVATVHLRETGARATYELRLIVAADVAGTPAEARPRIGIRKGANP